MKGIVRKYLDLTRQGSNSLPGAAVILMLAPFGILYGAVAKLRLLYYRSGLGRVYRAPVPVISVGNLAAGGKGKTPLVDYLGRVLTDRGLQVAVVSRGYGGASRQPVNRIKSEIDSDQAAARYGDEPVLLQRRNPQIEVVTARRRAEGVRYACAELAAEVVLLDDGFQHLAVHRDLDIVMLDATRPFGNGWPLPAGELREFPGSYRRADVLVLSRCSGADRLAPFFSGPVVRAGHHLQPRGRDLQGREVLLSALRGQRGVAFAGIAAPELFFAALRNAGLQLIGEVPLPDHVDYAGSQLERLTRLAGEADFLVTTEKDGVKLAAENFAIPCYQVPLQFAILSGEDLLRLRIDETLGQGLNMNVSDELMAILACPQCKGPVELNPDQDGIECARCRLRYPIRDDIPVMLIDEATPI